MSREENYWMTRAGRRLTRRQVLKAAAAAGLGIAGAGVAGCGSSSSPSTTSSGSARVEPTIVSTPTGPKSVVNYWSAMNAQTKVTRGGTLTAAMKAEPTTIDPLTSSSGWDLYITRGIYNALVNTGDKFTIIPDLAESWEQPDNLTVVFKLRKGVKFHDGTDFNADAVVYTIGERGFNIPTSIATRAAFSAKLKTWLKSVDKVDDYTVKLSLAKPYAPMYTELSMDLGMISSPTAVKKYGQDPREYGRLGPSGTGPFKFVEWIPGDHVTLTRNEAYWEKDAAGGVLPYVDKVIIKPITDAVVKITSLRSGTLDLIDDVPFEDKATVEADSNLAVKGDPMQAGMTICFNCEKPPFDNKYIRQAIAWAIDPEAFHRAIYFGVGQPGQTPIPPASWAHNPDLKPFKRDMNKAKALLAQGGQPSGFRMGWMCYRDYEAKIGEILQQQLAPLGIDVAIEMYSYAEMSQRKVPGKFDTYPQGIVPARDPDGYLSWYYSKGYMWNHWKSAKLDEIIEKAVTIYNDAERKKLYDEAQKLILDECPQISFHYENRMVGMTKKVQNYYGHPDGYMRYNYTWLTK